MAKPIPTTPADLARINTLFADRRLADTVAALLLRWRDEHEYENIQDYAKPLLRHMPKGFKLERMTKRPWGFVFSIGTAARYQFTASIRGANLTSCWKRLPDACAAASRKAVASKAVAIGTARWGDGEWYPIVAAESLSKGRVRVRWLEEDATYTTTTANVRIRRGKHAA